VSAPKPAVTSLAQRVGFYQTDAMGIMHHAQYVNLLENARVAWLEEHDEPYTRYVGSGLHFAVTRVDVRYRRAARFDDRLVVRVWIEWVRGASLGIAYAIARDGETLATARTEHAMVDADGRPVRIPRERRDALAARAGILEGFEP
jgi:acyl-CoA thioester hydrolase